jgi:glycerol uptake facilitator-like aquaporin
MAMMPTIFPKLSWSSVIRRQDLLYTKRGILYWEFLGVAIIVLANLVTASINPIGHPVVSTPICVGIAIATTFYGSGAHLNPTVTGLITVFAKIRWIRIFLYLAAAFGAALLIAGLWRLGMVINMLPGFALEQADSAAVVFKETLSTMCLLGFISIFIILERGIWTAGAIPVFLSLMQFTALGGADMNPAVTLGWFVAGRYGWGGFGAHLLGEMLAMVTFLIVGKLLRTLRRRKVLSHHEAFRT